LATVEAAELGSRAAFAPPGSEPGRTLATWIVLVGSSMGLAGAAVQTACHLIDAFVLDGRYPALQADAQGTVFDWMSGIAILAASAAVVAGSKRSRSRLQLRVLGVLIGYLAVDEVVGIHEQIGTAIAAHLPGILENLGDRVTPVIYLPLLGMVFALLWEMGGKGVEGGRLIRVGLTLLVGAILIRLAGAGVRLASGQVNGSIRPVAVAADQAFQLVGWALVATGLAARLPNQANKE
jgi:hypothetical protein